MNILTYLTLAAGIAIGGTLAGVYDALIDDPSIAREARQQGALAERQAWEDLRRRMVTEQERQKAEAQAKIDASEAERLIAELNHQNELESLNEAIEDEANAAADKSCGPVVSERLRNALQAIGR